MLDLNNCLAASVDHRYHDMSSWKGVDCVKTIVDVIWPCSCVKPQKAREMKPRLCFGDLTWVKPSIQSQTITWSAVNFKKQLTSVSSKLEPASEVENNAYADFCGVKEVYYGICASSEYQRCML